MSAVAHVEADGSDSVHVVRVYDTLRVSGREAGVVSDSAGVLRSDCVVWRFDSVGGVWNVRTGELSGLREVCMRRSEGYGHRRVAQESSEVSVGLERSGLLRDSVGRVRVRGEERVHRVSRGCSGRWWWYVVAGVVLVLGVWLLVRRWRRLVC